MSTETREATVHGLDSLVRQFMIHNPPPARGRLRVPVNGPWQDLNACYLSDWTDPEIGLGVPERLASRFMGATTEPEQLDALRTILAHTSLGQVTEVEKVRGGTMEIVAAG